MIGDVVMPKTWYPNRTEILRGAVTERGAVLVPPSAVLSFNVGLLRCPLHHTKGRRQKEAPAPVKKT
jgi:hypothetical protein